MEIINFVPETLFILVVAVNILGVFLKQIEFVKDNFIPVILLFFAVIFSIAMQGFTPEHILEGIVAWGTAVGAHQTIHQMKNKK